MESSADLTKVLASFTASYNVLLKQYSAGQDGPKMSSNAFLVLHTLCTRYTDGVTMSELAADLGLMKQQLTKLVNSLEEEGLAVRTRDAENRRTVRVGATEAGKARYDAMMSGFSARLRHSYFSALAPGEEEELVSCLTRLIGIFGSER